MRKQTGDYSLYRNNIFDLDRLNASTNFEGGTSLTYGFDYEKTFDNNEKLNFHLGKLLLKRKKQIKICQVLQV